MAPPAVPAIVTRSHSSGSLPHPARLRHARLAFGKNDVTARGTLQQRPTHVAHHAEPRLLLQVNKARSLAAAVLVFAVITFLNFGVATYWWPGLSGLLAIAGASIILCCSGTPDAPSHGAHVGAAWLCAFASAMQLTAVVIYVWLWAVVSSDSVDCDEYASGNHDSSSEDCEHLTGLFAWLIWPIILFDSVACVLFGLLTVFSLQAARAIASAPLSPFQPTAMRVVAPAAVAVYAVPQPEPQPVPKSVAV